MMDGLSWKIGTYLAEIVWTLGLVGAFLIGIFLYHYTKVLIHFLKRKF